jgi:tetraacyldisaccharide 4'-kinase
MLPLVPLYAAGAAMRAAGLQFGLEPVRRLRWQVVSVGNLSVGGTGKTPFTVALARLLQREGIHVDVLSRGYGRRSSKVEQVDPTGSAEQFGDEPLLIAQNGVPVYVGAQRYKAGRLAERESSAETGVHLLDDGFQHRQLARQADIVLVNSEDLADSVLPAGNLREPWTALRRASVLAVAEGDDGAVARLRELGLGEGREQAIWRYRREMIVPEIPDALARRPVVAFCGIARPEQFFAGLAQSGIALAATRAFPDHHRFGPADLAGLRRLLESTGSGALVTTAKDFVRLGTLATLPDPSQAQAGPILVADLEVVFADDLGIASWLRRVLELPGQALS